MGHQEKVKLYLRIVFKKSGKPENSLEKIPKCPTRVMFQNGKNNKLLKMNYKRLTQFSLWTTLKSSAMPLLLRFSYKHFLIYLGSDMLLLHAKHQKKGDMGFHRCCKMSVCARNGIKRGPNSLFPTEVSGLLPSHWIVRHKPLDSWWFPPLEDKTCNS